MVKEQISILFKMLDKTLPNLKRWSYPSPSRSSSP